MNPSYFRRSFGRAGVPGIAALAIGLALTGCGAANESNTNSSNNTTNNNNTGE